MESLLSTTFYNFFNFYFYFYGFGKGDFVVLKKDMALVLKQLA